MKIKIFPIFIFLSLLGLSVFCDDTRGIVFPANQLDTTLEIGKQVLLIIAVDEYEHWSPLQYPVKDAQKIRDVLISEYYIDEVYELYNEQATRANIIKVFTTLKDTLTVKDSLVIYYAGHGSLDEDSDTGAWIPADGEKDVSTQINWVPNYILRGIISKMEALHVLLISDSCFSGDILNTVRGEQDSPDPSHIPFYEKSYKRMSREVITSGASETVPDKSEFSRQLVMCLKKNNHPYLDTLTIFNEIKLGITATFPMMGDLKATGHQDGGSFILFKKNSSVEITGTYLTIIGQVSGNLFINNEFYKCLKSDEKIRKEVKPGTYKVEVHYQTGEVESFSVSIEAGKMEKVTFTGPSLVTELTTKPSRENYATLSLGFGMPIPIALMSYFMEIGYYPVLQFGYSFKTGLGRFSFGIETGISMEPPDKTIINEYTMYTLPVAIFLGYQTLFSDLFFIFGEMSGGAGFNSFVYPEVSTEEDRFVISAFIAPTIGTGINLTRNVTIAVYGSFLMIMFSNQVYMGIAPGIRCQYNIR